MATAPHLDSTDSTHSGRWIPDRPEQTYSVEKLQIRGGAILLRR
jgi:hypothetical protein